VEEKEAEKEIRLLLGGGRMGGGEEEGTLSLHAFLPPSLPLF